MKLSQYNYVIEEEGRVVIYNCKSSKILILKTKKDRDYFRKFQSSDNIHLRSDLSRKMHQRGMLVDNGIDEYSEVHKKIEDYYTKFDKTLGICIDTTLNCNFRCVYCPEKHIDKVFSHTRWQSLYKYVEKNVKEGKIETLSIAFFGGEPLLETKAIIKFLDKLKMLNKLYPDVKMTHSITTNGYLLTPRVYDKLTDLGIRAYQITLDGFAETHDKTRPRVDGKGTWDKIIENISYINSIDDGVRFTVRLNLNKDNESSGLEFVQWFSEKFSNKKFIYEFCPVVLHTYGDSSYPAYEDFNNVDKYKQEYFKNTKYLYNIESPLRFLGYTCKYAMKNFYTVNVDGIVSHCVKDFGDSIPVGYLNDKGEIEFNDNYNKWITGYETEECKTCVIYPLCAGRKCPHFKYVSTKERLDCLSVKKMSQSDIKFAILGFAEKYEKRVINYNNALSMLFNGMVKE